MVKTRRKRRKAPFDRKKSDKNRTTRLKEFRNSFKKGKACFECGSTERLQFHHVDRSEKVGDITRMKKKADIVKEIDKTVLLCSDCHIKTFKK